MHARFASGVCTASIDPRLRGISARRLPPSARVMTARDTVGDSSRVYSDDQLQALSISRAATKETVGDSSRVLNSADMMTRPSLSLAQQPRRLDRAPALAKCHLGLAGARRVFSTSWQRASPA